MSLEDLNQATIGLRKWLSFESVLAVLTICHLWGEVGGDAYVYGVIASAGIFFAANVVAGIKK